MNRTWWLVVALSVGVLAMTTKRALESYWWRTDTGLPNEPGPEAMANLERLRAFVEAYFPGSRVISAHRSHAVNKEVGGAKDSYHLRGLAVDLAPAPGETLEMMTAYARTLKAFGKLVEVIPYKDGHLHIAMRG